MPDEEKKILEIEVGDATVQATLHLPQRPEAAAPSPGALLCDDLPQNAGDGVPLLDALAGALVESGVAAALIKPDHPMPILAPGLADIASAVLRRLLLCDELDAARIGVLGRGTGAISAACLAARSDHVNRLCLLSPLNPADLSRSNGASRPAAAEKLGEAFIASVTELSPLVDIAVHDRPTLILHGAADRVVAPESAIPYCKALQDAGRHVRHELIALGDHEFAVPAAREVCAARIAGFFRSMTAAPVAGVRT